MIKCQLHLLPSLLVTAAEKTHPIQEQRIAFEVTHSLLKYHYPESGQCLLNVGLVTGWLAFLPWEGEPFGSVFERPKISDIVHGFVRDEGGEPWQTWKLHGILELLLDSPAGRHSLEAAGLWDQSFSSEDDSIRLLERENKDNSSLLRQRRQAVIISEGGRPLESGDIIQVDGIGLGTDAEDVLERLREQQVASSETPTSGDLFTSLATWQGGLRSYLPLR